MTYTLFDMRGDDTFPVVHDWKIYNLLRSKVSFDEAMTALTRVISERARREQEIQCVTLYDGAKLYYRKGSLGPIALLMEDDILYEKVNVILAMQGLSYKFRMYGSGELSPSFQSYSMMYLYPDINVFNMEEWNNEKIKLLELSKRADSANQDPTTP